jgi:P4 family phage/plasmid primase-like protien
MMVHGVSKQESKELFLSIFNNGSYFKWMKSRKIDPINRLNIVDDLKKELNRISKKLMELNPSLCDFVKNKDNKEGSFMFWYLSEIESRILEATYFYLKENFGIENHCVLCNDGIMIRRENYTNFLLENLNDYIYRLFEMRVEFIEKPMTEYLNIDMIKKSFNNSIDKNLYDDDFVSGVLSEEFKRVYNSKWLFSKNKLYFFRNHVWIEDNQNDTNLHNFLDTEFYIFLQKYSIQSRNELLESLKNATGDEKVIIHNKMNKLNDFDKNLKKFRQYCFRKMLISDIKNKICDDSIEFDNHPLLFCFNNCVYNLKTREFKKTAPYDLYLKTTCGYDYNFEYDNDKTTKLRELIDTIFSDSEIRDYYLQMLSTGLWGQLIENLFIATGKGGNGKSLINSLMLKTVGSYGYNLPNEVLLDTLPTGGNPQIASLHKKRFVLTSEPDSNKRVCGSTLKELTGNLEINARMLHSNDCKVLINQTLVMECNDMPLMNEVNDAINRRIRAIPFQSTFVSQEVYNKLDEETKALNIFVGDSYFKSYQFQDEYKQALFNILTEYMHQYIKNGYCFNKLPQDCDKITKAYLENSDDIFEFLKENFTCDENSDQYVYITDVYDCFTHSSYYSNMNKLERRRYNKKYFDEKLESNIFLRKYYKGRNCRVGGVKINKAVLYRWVKN